MPTVFIALRMDFVLMGIIGDVRVLIHPWCLYSRVFKLFTAAWFVSSDCSNLGVKVLPQT